MTFSITDPVIPDISLDEIAKSWIDTQVEGEQARFKKTNTRVLPLAVKSCSIQVESIAKGRLTRLLNRIDVNTGFPFEKIKQIMVSEAIDYPHKENYQFVHVLLFTDKAIPLMLPYLFSRTIVNSESGEQVENNLSEWLFVNQKGDSARHKVAQFHSV